MSFLKDLLDYYNFSEDDYAAFMKLGNIDDIPDPFVKAASFSSLIDFIKESIDSKKKFVIYGDYDVDGITSTTILVSTLRKLGAEVGYFIPSRYKEGYGLSCTRIKEFAEKNYDILIAVDNGITKVEEIKLAKSLNMKTIIIDHHQAPDILPEADYIFQQFISGYSDYNISAAFLALLVSYGVLKTYDDYFVTLAGIAVISDLMPLKEANVALVRMALKNLKKNHYETLFSLVSTKSNFDINIFSYEIIPILNSPGRIKQGLEVNDAVKLLLESDLTKIRNYASKFLEYNKERKEMVSNGFDLSLIDSNKDIIIYESKLPAGVSGLLAGKLLSSFNKPIIVYSQDPVTLNYVASLRSNKNYNIVDSLSPLKDFFLDFGGHATAAGFTIKKECLDEFINVIPNFLVPSSFEVESKSIPLDIYNFNVSDYKYIESLEPFGIEHPEPLFIVEVEASDFVSSNKNPEHLFLKINKNLKICFFSGKSRVPSEGKISLSGHLRKNSFYTSGLFVDFIVEDIVESKTLI